MTEPLMVILLYTCIQTTTTELCGNVSIDVTAQNAVQLYGNILVLLYGYGLEYWEYMSKTTLSIWCH